MPAAARRTLAPLAVVTTAAFVFALLLILVRLHWAPLESADHGAAARLNRLVAGHAGTGFSFALLEAHADGATGDLVGGVSIRGLASETASGSRRFRPAGRGR